MQLSLHGSASHVPAPVQTPESIRLAREENARQRAEFERDNPGWTITDSGAVKRLHLAPIVVMPLRMHLAETSAEQKRQDRLAEAVAELIEAGYTTADIRRQCEFEDAAC